MSFFYTKTILKRRSLAFSPIFFALWESRKPTRVGKLKNDRMAISKKINKIKNPFKTPKLKKNKIKSQLNKNYSFDNFISCDSNQFARKTGLFIANNIDKNPFNPLFLFGCLGTGKTHLVNAIGNEIKKMYLKKNVLYVSAETFTQQYINSVKKNNRNDFIHFYQSIDVLIIEDVQFLSGKSGTQDVFFHIFNYLHQNKKQIILTSDKAPVDVVDIEPLLLSRFKFGFSLEMTQPKENTHQFLTNYLTYHDIKMSDEIIEYLSQNDEFNMGVFDGFLLCVKAEYLFNGNEITLKLAKNIFEKIMGKPKTN